VAWRTATPDRRPPRQRIRASSPSSFGPRKDSRNASVRDAVREVFRTQLSDAPDEAIVEARRQLNRTYDFFTSRFGRSTQRNVKASPMIRTCPAGVARRIQSGDKTGDQNCDL